MGWDRLGRVIAQPGADDLHLDAVCAVPWLDIAAIRARGLHVVVDAVEGAGGAIVPRLLERLGVRCTPLYCGLSGNFPHDPEPTPAHLAALCDEVRRHGADLGVAVDPDADRLALVAGDGTALSEELTLALATDFLLGRTPGDVAVNLSTTGLIEKVAGRHGCKVWRTPVGEANVVETILGEGCVLGGEGNGGVIYPAVHAGRDSLVGIAMLLQHMADRKATLGALAAELPPVAMVKTKVEDPSFPSGDALVARLERLGPGAIDRRDGVKWTGTDAWVHVRSSNTEPAVRIIAEAKDEGAAVDLINRVKSA